MTDQSNHAAPDPAQILWGWLAKEDATHYGEFETALNDLLLHDAERRRAIARLTAEKRTAEAQRDLLGGNVSGWIGRFYGQKVANGDLAPGALPQIVAAEINALEQGCARIAQEQPQ